MFGLKCVVHAGQSVHKFCAQYFILAGLIQCLLCADERLATIRPISGSEDSGCERSCVTWIAWKHQSSFWVCSILSKLQQWLSFQLCWITLQYCCFLVSIHVLWFRHL